MPGLEESFWFHSSPSAQGPMSDGVASEQVKKFFFTSRRNLELDQDDESLEIYIPEVSNTTFIIYHLGKSPILCSNKLLPVLRVLLLQASYSFYTWPSAPVLAWFLWEHRGDLVGKRVLELGSGTALPGIVASKCGALVTLSDSASLPKSLQHIKRSCELNGVLSQVKVVGVTWGLFLSGLFSIGPLDLILGSDCFYEPTVFEDIVVTVAFLLERNSNARFLCTYQERSADWSIEHLLNKWGLTCTHIPLAGLGANSGINIQELMQDHTIHLLDIRRAS
ncbi:histone-arginine methyltransferase METTL23 isoform X1 [Neodiprion pinetum]|uniref:Probable methyltransferase-like protein 23 isoform X1 n=1 Tax=Neodiprion lecontei TaxID=441921 RepID=A0ABM3FHM3_NEOLC|nr:probable methyltransferase-like protein 23 isoform X1 [Neodiprion pinetum]XP_046587524.1 probable methyltransferase-like protein 23 isoform X1 [Neodiprion lecontei]